MISWIGYLDHCRQKENLLFHSWQKQQIICITHLSQIASQGKVHFKISKSNNKTSTSVEVNRLNKEERVNEIASLISGKIITDSGYEQAMKLLANG